MNTKYQLFKKIKTYIDYFDEKQLADFSSRLAYRTIKLLKIKDKVLYEGCFLVNEKHMTDVKKAEINSNWLKTRILLSSRRCYVEPAYFNSVKCVEKMLWGDYLSSIRFSVLALDISDQKIIDLVMEEMCTTITTLRVKHLS